MTSLRSSIKERLIKLLSDIQMSETYSEKIIAAFDSLLSEHESLSIGQARQMLSEADVMSNDEKLITVLLIIALEERKYGVWQRYPEEVFIHTMHAFALYVEFYREAVGHEGYGKSLWPLRITDAKVFRLGIFEYELEESKEISMHLPSDTVLTKENMLASIKKAKEFFTEYFPDIWGCPIFCESWLLSPVLEDMLPPDSKIRQFRSLFEITEFDPNVDLYLEYVFKLEYFQRANGVDLNSLCENTSLQRAMKKFVLSGGKPGAAKGYLKQFPTADI